MNTENKSEKNRFLAFTIRELIGSFVVIIILSCFLYPAMKASRGIGDSMLRDVPNEIHREYHSNGMSIIRPGVWKTSRITSGAGLDRLDFLGGVHRRYPCRIWLLSAEVTEENEIPDSFAQSFQTEQFKETSFQNEPAYEHIEYKRNGSLEDPAYVQGKLYFFRGRRFYAICWLFFNKEAKIPENLPLYLESFQPAKEPEVEP